MTEDHSTVTEEAPPPSVERRALVIVAAGLIFVLGVVALVLAIASSITRQLPELRSLSDYAPPQATVVYGREGQVVARFAQERRTVVPFERIPRVMVDAVLAAEDSDFYEHEGLDYLGIARCAVRNLLSGAKRCGGSTITQQTAKTFFLTPRRTYGRKLKEAVLAKRLEEALTKNDILYLYLNQIYFGHGAYGVQEAARVYFGVDVEELTLSQAALLAGLPKSPAHIDPYTHPERAKERRRYVLGRMRETQAITAEAFDAAVGEPIALDWQEAEADLDNNNHFAAHVRRLLEASHGSEATLTAGLEVYTGLDPVQQRAAEEAVDRGLRAVDKRQGWRGPIFSLERNEVGALRHHLQTKIEQFDGSSTADSPLVWDLSKFARVDRGARPPELAELAEVRPASMDRPVAGLVVSVDDGAREAIVDLGGFTVRIPHRTGMSWARPFRLDAWSARPRLPSEVLSIGDVVFVGLSSLEPAANGNVLGTLEQEPRVEAAVVVIDPTTRDVRALVGGHGVGAGRFNRATQARRQPGSTFKPFVYGAAFESRESTPVSVCLDAPRVYRDPGTGRSWKPENYGGSFDGEITLRKALTLSKNLCSIALIDAVGIEAVSDFAHRAGIVSPLPHSLTLGLGSGEVTPLEMVNAYATLAARGRHAEPVFIRRVRSSNGALLERRESDLRQTIRPSVVFQVTSLMQSVVEEGTGRSVRDLGRPIAGKTGTTNDARDAWFIGFTPDVVAGVWVGFDDNVPLGPNETGGRAAIPIWVELMKVVLRDAPVHDFLAPEDIVFAWVDPASGDLAPPGSAGARVEPFLAGTEPTTFHDEAAPVDRGLWEDFQ